MSAGDGPHANRPADPPAPTAASDAAGGTGGGGNVGGGAGSPGDVVSSFEKSLASAVKAAQKDTSDPLVMAAFMLGWHMAQLFQPLPRPIGEVDDGDLPGFSSLGQQTRALMLVDSIQVGIGKLSAAITTTTLTVPNVTKLRQSVNGSELNAPDTADHLHTELKDLHRTLLTTLTAVDSRFGRAYGLGRALADTCRKPRDLGELVHQFGENRIGNLRGWLDELSTSLPPHSAHSVSASLAQWVAWSEAVGKTTIPSTGGVAEHAALSEKEGGTVTKDDAIARAHRQGELWRAVLSGEKHGQELLELDNYVKAAGESAKRMAAAGRKVIWHFKLLTLLIVLLIAGGIVLIALGGPAKEVAGATSLLSAVGLSWKGLGGALGKLAGQLEQPMWGAIVDLAITDAITLLPNNADEKGGRQMVALQMAAATHSQQALR